ISLLIAVGATIFAMYYIPTSNTGQFIVNYVIELQWFLLIVFSVVLAVAFALAKVSFTLMIQISKIISKGPFSIVFATLILIQAIMLLFGYSIINW
ncbi:MAG: hypothetical protein ACTSXU_17310, partial [Promethearchaeota archaeon]